MSRLFKEVAGLEPHYIIEVNGRRFDKLSERDKIKTLILDLMRPKKFGSDGGFLENFLMVNSVVAKKNKAILVTADDKFIEKNDFKIVRHIRDFS